MKRSPAQRVVLLLSGLGATMLGACFTGEDAAGLPCEVDEECGVGQRCKLGFCDGPSASGCGNGAVEPDFGEECDEGPNNADEAACTSTCKNNVCGDGLVGPGEACDDGNDDDTDGCSNTCRLGSCGDGKVDDGEACDDGGQNSDTGACTTACKLATCGDGYVHAGVEACDEGGETATCDDDCTPAECGDGNVNEAFGEGCDDGDTTRDAMCMENCTLPILYDDAESDIAGYMKTQSMPIGSEYTSMWTRSTTKAVSGTYAWATGPRQGTNQNACAIEGCWGTSRLETKELDLTGVEAPIRLEFQHQWDFEDFGQADSEADGATLEIFVDGAWTSLVPDGGYPHTIDDSNGCGSRTEANPLLDTASWSHQSPGTGWASETVDLSTYAGKTVRLGFHVGYDCADADPTEGWFVDDIVVWRPVTLGP